MTTIHPGALVDTTQNGENELFLFHTLTPNKLHEYFTYRYICTCIYMYIYCY